jgi:hypothetical protein
MWKATGGTQKGQTANVDQLLKLLTSPCGQLGHTGAERA